MPEPENYTIGWICAIKTEYVAARAFLDEEHKDAKDLLRRIAPNKIKAEEKLGNILSGNSKTVGSCY